MTIHCLFVATDANTTDAVGKADNNQNKSITKWATLGATTKCTIDTFVQCTHIHIH